MFFYFFSRNRSATEEGGSGSRPSPASQRTPPTYLLIFKNK